MHIGIISRGSQRDVNRFFEELQSKYVPIDIKGEKMMTNIVYRPLQLGEIIFPESSLQQVLATLKPLNWERKSIYFEMLKKAMGLKKIPEYDGKTLGLPVWNKNIELVLLGFKEDKKKDGFEQL